MKTVTLLGYSIFNDCIKKISLNKKTIINTINQYSYCIADKDPDFKKALQQSDIILPDGIAIVAATKLLVGEKIKKIAGADIHFHFLNELNKTNGSCFYMGSNENTLKKIRERISLEYPNIIVHTYSPPFKPEFDNQDNTKILEQINKIKPDILFVGMTAPKQEKWVAKHKFEIDSQIICSVGAVFDFFAGTTDRPNKIWIKLGLEWFVRLIKEPKRMWKRYLYYGPIFIFAIMKKKYLNK